ncbi:MAG: hypothetical protein HFJ29_04830 [Clostridia bacterium]|nr:hypothetical protein [Clostridia bacterium]
MNKKVIVIIICVMLGLVLGVVLSVNNESNDREDLESYSKIYDENGNVINVMQGTLIQKEVIETISNTKIQGIVESSHNEYIYIFNGQHFGEYGFEMKEYTRANIDNRKQECIDYYTSEKYDTSYIQDGDLIFCTGDLKKYSTGDDDFDTKDNPIIVLKEKDYNNLKRKTISNAKTGTITVGEYYDISNEVYIKYDISDKEYKLPFVLKFNIDNETKIVGNLEREKKIKVQYKDLNVPINELELKTIEVVEKQ